MSLDGSSCNGLLSIAELWIYPVKSCRGTQLGKMEIDEYGPLHDREWVIVDENNKFITQREKKVLAQVVPDLSGQNFQLRFQNQIVRSDYPVEQNIFTLPPSEKVQVWSSILNGFEENSQISEFLSDILSQKVRLMRFVKKPQRKISDDLPQLSYTQFTDQFPFHIVHLSLMKELCEKAGISIPHEQFRANIYLEGPYIDEKNLKTLELNQQQFILAKPCSRCVITTQDQKTGESLGKEPLKTLAAYRQNGSRIYFGMYYIHQGSGIIHVGNKINNI